MIKHLMDKIGSIQTDLVTLEGMMEASKIAAYNNSPVEYIGNSLEVMLDYLKSREEMLDQMNPDIEKEQLTNMTIRCDITPFDKSNIWTSFISSDENKETRTEEVTAALDRIVPYIENMPDNQEKPLYLAIREVGAASRKQGFTEGMMAAVKIFCGAGGENANG